MAQPESSPDRAVDAPGERPEPTAGIDYSRLYAYRFRAVDDARRREVWVEIAAFLWRMLGRPRRVLDAAAGSGEFINAVPAEERWAVDAVEFEGLALDDGVHTVIGDVLEVDLPGQHFDAIFVSNLLEHFPTQESIGTFLGRMRGLLRPGGQIGVMGPNFRYCMRNYFDCADHTLALTHLSVAEHLYAAGFEVVSVRPKFLPFSFVGRLPTHRLLVRAYLRLPIAWRLMGKQFLVLGQSPMERGPDVAPSSGHRDS